MELNRNSQWCRALLFAVASLFVPSCGDESTEPKDPCYTVDDLHATELAVADTVAARTAFMMYLTRLDETNGYPVFNWMALEYSRSAGTEHYGGRVYWGIVARGVHSERGTQETQMFRVRQDGTVVLMLGCI